MNKLILVAFLGLIATVSCVTYGGYFAGTIIGTYYNTSQAQCQYWCDNPGVVSNCYGWSWNSATLVCEYFSSAYGFYYNGGYGGCHSSTATWYSGYASPATTTAATGFGTTTVQTTATTTKTHYCTFTNGTNYPVNDLYPVYATSASDCCNKCGAVTGCAAFAFQATTGTCFLKTAVNTATTTGISDSTIGFGTLVA